MNLTHKSFNLTNIRTLSSKPVKISTYKPKTITTLYQNNLTQYIVKLSKNITSKIKHNILNIIYGPALLIHVLASMFIITCIMAYITKMILNRIKLLFIKIFTPSENQYWM